MAERERATIQELAGRAVNASHLEHRALSGGSAREMPIDVVGALGAAAAAVRLGADVENVPIAAARGNVYSAVPDERDALAAELAPLLWHIRFGRHHEQIPRAVALFARWMTYRAIIAQADPAVAPQRLMHFSARVLHEWLSDRCQACGGSGKQERTREGRWVRPLGRMARNAHLRTCEQCNGTRRPLPMHAQRWRQLELAREDYEAQRWPQRFNQAHTWLGTTLSRLTKPLTAELERRKRRP